jgi:hypothetical protein
MRAAAVLAAALVLLWLTLPALVSPASVAAMIRDEDRLHAAWLGEAAGHMVLARALRWLGQASEAGREVGPGRALPPDPLSLRFAAAAEAVMQTPYIQRVRMMGRLALYRLAALAEWFSLGLPLLVAAIVDGAVMRTVRLRSFAHASPVLFGIGLHGTLAVLGCMALALLIPIQLHTLVWGAAIAALAATLRTAVSNFHRVR